MRETVEVANVRCGGCAATIVKTLKEKGFTEVSVDLECEPRTVTAEIADEAQSAHFKTVLRKLGYPLFDEKTGVIDFASLKAKSLVSCSFGKFTVNDTTK